MNNKGFTLVEMLMVILLLTIITIVVISFAFKAQKTAKEQTTEILKKNIEEASKVLYTEYMYGDKTKLTSITDTNGTITVTLQQLINLGFLQITNDDCEGNNCIKNPKTNEDISNCTVTVTQDNDSNYQITLNSSTCGDL